MARGLAFVMLLACGVVAAQERVKSVAALRDEFNATLSKETKLRLAADLNRRAAQPKLPAKDKTTLREVALKLAEANEPSDLRVIACYMLRSVGTKADAPVLHKLMDDSEQRVRYAAAGATRVVHDDDTVKALVELLKKHGVSSDLHDTHPIDAIAAVGTPKAKEALQKIHEVGSGAIREKAAKAIDSMNAKGKK
jgi:HEAT repeat protein